MKRRLAKRGNTGATRRCRQAFGVRELKPVAGLARAGIQKEIVAGSSAGA